MPLFTQVNSKVVSVAVGHGQPVLARRGAMLGYTGDVSFRPVGAPQGAGYGGGGQGGGFGGALGAAGGMLGRAMTGESSSMMLAEGAGEVWYGYRGLHVVLVQLDGSAPLSVEADRLLAHDASLQSTVVFLGQQGGVRGAVRGAMTGQGLFTTQLSGVGSVALLAHGGAFPLPVSPSTTTGVDPQAYVGHTGNLEIGVTASVGWRDAVGRGSGEAFQLTLRGAGTVYVQASEKKF